MAALPLYQMLSGLGDTIYSGFAEADKRRTLADLGKDIQSGNLEGASQKLLASGDIGSALKLVEMKRAQGNQQQLKEVLGQDPMMGGGVSAPGPQAQGGLPPAAIAEEFAKRGYGPNAVAGILGNFKTESGMRPDAMGDGGTSGGLGQWHKDRFTNLKNFAAQQGADWRDPRVQVAFTDHELRTTEAPVMQRLQAARTPEEAAKAFVGFERPAGYTPNNPTGAMYMDRRIAGAREFGGGAPVQVADASGAVPQSAGGNDARENLLRFRTKLTSILPGLDASSATAVQARIGDIDRRLSEMRSDTQYERSLAAEDRRTQTQLSAEERRAQRQMEAEDRRTTRQLASEERRAASANEKATGEQANAATFSTRMSEADKIISDPAIYGSGLGVSGAAKNIASGIPVVGNMIVGQTKGAANFQRYDQAQRDFVNAVLRKESGAAISPNEFENARKQYFPQPGDTPEVIQQKAQNRTTAIDTIAMGATPSFKKEFSAKREAAGQSSYHLKRAKEALAAGVPQEEVMKALQGLGVDPSALQQGQ
jgi:hypothetical protein